MLKGFKEFIIRGNVVDMAVGIVIGAAFTGVVTAFTDNVLMAFIGAIVGKPNFNKLVLEIGKGKIQYGMFLTQLVAFLITAAAIYFTVVAPLNALAARRKAGKAEEVDPTDNEKMISLLEEIAAQGRR
ncbi:MAG: large conductance mechanosensitive channel protein MscL [Microthrixaceae bacterium]